MAGPSAAAVRYHREQQARRIAQELQQSPRRRLSNGDTPKEQQHAESPLMGNKKTAALDTSKHVKIILSQRPTGKYPKFRMKEIFVGTLLGQGGFCSAHEIRGFRLKVSLDDVEHDSSTSNKDNNDVGRAFLARHCLRSNGKPRFVLKQIASPQSSSSLDKKGRKKVTAATTTATNSDKENRRMQQGMLDLQVEIAILSKLHHPHILQLRGTVEKTGGDDGILGLVLDHLFGTLEDRINYWQGKMAAYTGLRGKANDRKGTKKQGLYYERLQTACDIGSAIQYMHEKKIIYRDLKPENVGYNVNDQVQLFDFGLAKDLSTFTKSKESKDGETPTYQLTELCGSPRYMAPEVYNGFCYNHTCDVYSFGILLWQLLSLQAPFELYTPWSMREKVYNGAHKRPLLKDDIIPKEIQPLLTECWHKDLQQRPEMDRVIDALEKEIKSQSGSHRRSNPSFSMERQHSVIFPSISAAFNPGDHASSDDDSDDDDGFSLCDENIPGHVNDKDDTVCQDLSCSSDAIKRMRSPSLEDILFGEEEQSRKETFHASFDTKRMRHVGQEKRGFVASQQEAMPDDSPHVSRKDGTRNKEQPVTMLISTSQEDAMYFL